jgi:hypothetical protein
MAKRRGSRSDLDSPWKDVLQRFLRQFLAYFFPHIHDDIDWERGYESLDKELNQILRTARVKKRLADKLFKVWRKNGAEAWLLIHVEVQGQREEDFPERMFIYNYRIYDRYQRTVVGLAVLCDADPDWRPERFAYGAWGGETGIRFLTAKVFDYQGREEELERDPNPFAAIVLAQLKVLQTRNAPEERRRWKVRLIKGLYHRGLSADDVRQLFWLIEWMIQLPAELEEQFQEEIYRFEEEKKMPYVSNYVSNVERMALKRGRDKGIQLGERRGRKQGLKAGLLEGIALDLELKFGPAGMKLMVTIEAIQDVKQLRGLLRAIKSAGGLAEVKQLLR